MTNPRVLVLYKPMEAVLGVSSVQNESGRWRRVASGKFRERHPERATRYETAAAQHEASIAATRKVLGGLGLTATWLPAGSARGDEACDLILSVGGDGTLLAAARAAGSRPVFGINSAPDFSVGHFCAARIANLETKLEGALQGALPTVALTRLAVEINGNRVPSLALNEVLFAHISPAGTSRYLLGVDGNREAHRSSGVWVSTAAGSTGAIRSAGGEVMALERRELQYLVREPYMVGRSTYRLVTGFTPGGVEIVSETDRAAVYLDAHADPRVVQFGDEIRIAPADAPLTLFVPEAASATESA